MLARLAIVLFALSFVVTVAPLGWAQSPSTDAATLAIAKAAEGRDHFESGRYAQALAAFTDADALYHSPVLLLYRARTHAKLRQLVVARDRYRELASEKVAPEAPESWRRAQEEGAGELAQIEAAVPQITIVVAGDASSIRATLDGYAAAIGTPVAVDPGDHRVGIQRGEAHAERTISLLVGERRDVVLALPIAKPVTPALPPVVDDASGLNVPALILGLLGGAAVTAGLVVGGVALHEASNATDALPASCDANHRCPQFEAPNIEPSFDDARTLARVSDGLWIGGAVFVVAGLIVWLADPFADPPRRDGAFRWRF